MKIGILAIQGSVVEHRIMLERLGVTVQEVRLPEDLSGIQGIILPGGESTAQSKLMRRFGLFDELKKQIEAGLPAWGTCAGAILLSKKTTGKNCEPTLEVMDIEANRNAYGGQLESFEVELEVDFPSIEGAQTFAHLRGKTFIQGIFIRAPKLSSLSDQVKILCEHENQSVMLRQGHMLATSFHPELTEDTSFHEYFLGMCAHL